MDLATLIPALGALVVVAIIFLLLDGGSSSGAQKRIKSVANSGSNSGDKSIFAFLKQEDTNSRRKQIEASIGNLEAEQKDKAKKQKSLKSRLIQANSDMTPQTFMLISFIVGAAAGGVAFFISRDPKIAAAVAFAFGLGVPRWYLGFLIGRRQKKFSASFADAMDIIVRGVRTGLPLGDCLKIIAHESPEPVSSEFKLVVEGESVGVPIEVCLERMYERMPISEVNFFATVLNIQRTTGGNLGESLANLSNVLRGRKMLREKIKALSAEAKASAMIVGALPIVVMVLVTLASPDYMEELYTTSTGHRNLMIGAGMMLTGIVVMKKMINFKI